MKQNSTQKVNYNIRKIFHLYKADSILIAISGGPDSMCLMKLLNDYAKIKKLCLNYIYIDHQWHYDSYKHVQHLINQIEYYKFNISVYQIKRITCSETSARKIRYKTIINHATKNQHNIIITAHNSTDKIETFIQQIIRGTSMHGATSLNFMNKLDKIFFFVR